MTTAKQADLNRVPSPPAFERLEAQSRRALQISDVLEAVADDLPRFSAAMWREARQLCRTDLRRHLLTTIKVVIPALQKEMHGDPDCKAFLARILMDRHEELERLSALDDMFADASARGAKNIEHEALGFMLRAQFEAIRRLVAWDTDVLYPIASRWLREEDLENGLSQCLDVNQEEQMALLHSAGGRPN